MIKIIENNYNPVIKTKTVKHNGYIVICKNCNSMLQIEKEDIDDGVYLSDKHYFCPCCKHNQIFIGGKKISWEETITYTD